MKFNQGFGCKAGGFPDCQKPNDLFCRDGTQVDQNAIMRWKAKTVGERRALGKEYTGCICSDGVMPRFVSLLTHFYLWCSKQIIE